MFRMVSESMLANVIAFVEAGVPLEELQQVVGRDGGTIIGRRVVLQTPIANHLSEDDVRQLIERHSKLVGEYSKGRQDYDLINNIKLRNGVSSKVAFLRRTFREAGN